MSNSQNTEIKIKFVSEYNDFTIFLSDMEIGAKAVVYDKESGYCLAQVVGIEKDGDYIGADYDGEFILDDGCYYVGVNYIRTALTPNEFSKNIAEYLGRGAE